MRNQTLENKLNTIPSPLSQDPCWIPIKLTKEQEKDMEANRPKTREERANDYVLRTSKPFTGLSKNRTPFPHELDTTEPYIVPYIRQ